MRLIESIVISISAIMALYIHLDFNISIKNITNLGTYAVLCGIVSIPISIIFRLDRTIWRLSSLSDYLNVVRTVVATVVIASVCDFLIERMLGVPRAIPLIQTALSIAILVGVRVIFRSVHRSSRIRKMALAAEVGTASLEIDNVLLVGVNREAELYAQFARELSTNNIEVVGTVAEADRHVGLTFSGLKVLGKVSDIFDILRTLEVHGITVDHIVVSIQRQNLTKDAAQALAKIEEAGDLPVDYFHELMFPRLLRSAPYGNLTPAQRPERAQTHTTDGSIHFGRFWKIKRFLDLVAALALIFLLVPLFALVALLVAFDVGLPLTFWQRRPGRHGRPFHLMKFRTMRGAHDSEGQRLPDDARTSRIGALIRKTRLDELPQLLHILVGDMSFVGPRPLLPSDLPHDPTLRLMVRPGLTGWAQVQGGRVLSPEDKAILDEWYVRNASLQLDIKILLLTIPMILLGES